MDLTVLIFFLVEIDRASEIQVEQTRPGLAENQELVNGSGKSLLRGGRRRDNLLGLGRHHFII